MPTDLPSLRPAAPSSHLPNFISTVTLVNSLSRASGLIKSLRICSAFRKRNLLRQLAIHRNQLNSWWDTLLIETHCQNIKHDEPSFRCNIHLEIYYSTVLIYLGRPFIFQEASAPLQVASEATSESSAYTYEASEIANSLCGDSLHASIRVIELCQHLEDSFGLAHVSYTEFNGCRVALLALIAHSIRNPNITLSNFLNQGMSLIRNMCVGLESARSEIVVLESLERARERLFGHLELDNQHAKKELAGYEQFREWANLWKPEAMERDIASGLTDSGTVFEQPFFDSTASFDTSFSSFPLELQEFSVIPGLNYEL